MVRRNRGNLPKDLPRIEKVIEPDSLDCPCGCGEMHRIGADRTERLDIIPAQIRPIALTRKNALFAGHDEGGRAWGRIASLIATAKINGVEPFAYFKATLEAIANGHPASRIDQLLPWNFQPSN